LNANVSLPYFYFPEDLPMHNSRSEKLNRGEDNINTVSTSIANEFHRFVGDVEELFKATTLVTGDDLIKASQKLGARIETAKRAAEDIGGSIYDRARKSAATTNQYVHDHSWAVVGASVVGSFLVGYLLSRREK
jgi:ElaB/YqjD/DUF883 family membrane-anchored ribosome-binding protein